MKGLLDLMSKGARVRPGNLHQNRRFFMDNRSNLMTCTPVSLCWLVSLEGPSLHGTAWPGSVKAPLPTANRTVRPRMTANTRQAGRTNHPVPRKRRRAGVSGRVETTTRPVLAAVGSAPKHRQAKWYHAYPGPLQTSTSTRSRVYTSSNPHHCA